MIPRYVITPTRNRPKWLVPLVGSMARQADAVVVLDNGSIPPLSEDDLNMTGGPVYVIHDAEQPPNIARFFNLLFDRCEKLALEAGAQQWDVAVVNDDALIPAGWLDLVTTALREHPTAVIAHTGGSSAPPFDEPYLLDEISNDRWRMCPHAFVIRGEVGLRTDEQFRWWFQDTDLDWQARMTGGVLGVPGPRVTNALANDTTVGQLQEQARLDEAAFLAKWDIEL